MPIALVPHQMVSITMDAAYAPGAWWGSGCREAVNAADYDSRRRVGQQVQVRCVLLHVLQRGQVPGRQAEKRRMLSSLRKQ